jgi:alkylation response protein AidB-like acyl-CoA dehydrogenase
MHPGPEQDDLRRVVATFLDDVAPLESVRAQLDADDGRRPGVWARMTELGIPGLTIAEALGGTGAGPVELVTIMSELGRVLATEPVLSTLSAADLLARSGTPVAEDRLARIASGACVATVADSDGRWHDPFGSVTAQGDRLTGACAYVPDGASADVVVVAATSPSGPGLYLVEGDSPGLSREPQAVFDGTRKLARLTFSDVASTPLLQGSAAFTKARDTALLALAAEQLGGARGCLRMAVDHAHTRHAFGRPIGSFQAIKHRCATLHLEIEAAWAALLHAARSAAHDGPDLPLLAAAAKASCSEVYLRAAAANIQVHGGIGFTWEHPAHLHLRRARASYEMYGPPALHEQRAATMLGL